MRKKNRGRPRRRAGAPLVALVRGRLSASGLPGIVRLLLFLLLLLLAACARRDGRSAERLEARPEQTSVQATLPPPRAEAGATAAAPRPMSPVKPASPSQAAPLPMARPSIAAIASPRAFSLAAPEGPLMPEDFAIGPLAAPRSADPELEAAAGQARRFLDSLVAGAPDEKLVLASRLGLVRLELEAALGAAKSARYRLGELTLEGDAALAPIRLSSPSKGVGSALPSRASGFVYLRLEEGTWWIEDLDIDEAALASPGIARAVPFEPRLPEAAGHLP